MPCLVIETLRKRNIKKSIKTDTSKNNKENFSLANISLDINTIPAVNADKHIKVMLIFKNFLKLPGLYACHIKNKSSATAPALPGSLLLQPLLAYVTITEHTAQAADKNTHLLIYAGSCNHNAVIYSKNKFIIKLRIKYKSA